MPAFLKFAKKHGDYVQCVWFNVVNEEQSVEFFKSVYKGKAVLATVSGNVGRRVLAQISMPEELQSEEDLLESLENEARSIFAADLR